MGRPGTSKTWKPDQQFEIERILNVEMFDAGLHYFVKWLGYSDEDNSWVHESDFCGYFALLKKFKTKHMEKIKSLRKKHSLEKICGVKIDKFGHVRFGFQWTGFQQKNWLREFDFIPAEGRAELKKFMVEHRQEIRDLQKSYKNGLRGMKRKRKGKEEVTEGTVKKKRGMKERGQDSTPNESQDSNSCGNSSEDVRIEVLPATSTRVEEAQTMMEETCTDLREEETNSSISETTLPNGNQLDIPDAQEQIREDSETVEAEMDVDVLTITPPVSPPSPTPSMLTRPAKVGQVAVDIPVINSEELTWSEKERKRLEVTQYKPCSYAKLRPTKAVSSNWKDDDSDLDTWEENEKRRESLKWKLRPLKPRRRFSSEEPNTSSSSTTKKNQTLPNSSNENTDLCSTFYLTTDNNQRNLVHRYVTGEIDFDKKDEEVRFIARVTKKAVLYQQDCDGNTPLHSAVLAGEDRFIVLLLELGSPVGSIRNNDGYTPLECAYVRDKELCLHRLLNNGANFQSLSDLPMEEGSEVDLVLSTFKEDFVEIIESLRKERIEKKLIRPIEGVLRETVTFPVNDGTLMKFNFSCSGEEAEKKEFFINIEHFGAGQGEGILPKVFVNRRKVKLLRSGFFQCKGVKERNFVRITINDIGENNQFLAVQVFMK